MRSQVLAGVLLVTLAAFAVFDVTAISELRRYLLNRTDSNLQAVVSLARPVPVAVHTRFPGRVSIVAGSRSAPPPKPATGRSIEFAAPHIKLRPAFLDQYYLAFVRKRGAPRVFIEGNPHLVPRQLRALGGVASWRAIRSGVSVRGNTQLRLWARPIAGGTLVASTSIGDVNKTVGRLGLILIIGSIGAGLLVAAGVIFVLRRGLRPIEVMAAEADRITAGDLADRVSRHDARSEVGRLGTALNGMLTRIETSVAERAASQELTRRFFADASHELRTPLASLRANAELYQQGALTTRPQVDEAMRRIALEAQRMGKLVDDMLRLARLDQYPDRDHDLVDLSALVLGCAEAASVTGARQTWRTSVAPGLATTGDQELLRRAVDNLLANVRTHTPAGTVATISAARSNGSVVIDVSDDGPGVAAELLPRLFDRFYRGAPETPRDPGPVADGPCPGSGLGLAIVTAVAATHHGTAAASLNEPHGLRVTMTLPAAEAPEASTRPEGPASLLSEDRFELG
ncbi:MAG TPA: HAMP domain-containing sensor histidine kinase [Streptosporangiaceae bacterium]|nr:HAMP domain-containing sensor histidine kinase [Streptosporangiaceae bacterium]